MDITALQAQEAALQTSIVTDETTLANDQADLVKVQLALADATLVNALEALTADKVSEINGLLASDGSALVLMTPEVPETT